MNCFDLQDIPIISIIVPVYNAEIYLCRCIDSILSQTFTDFELILIDDGSPDYSGAICDQYAEKDNRIRVFHKKNGGVSSARNYGIDKALGEYIIFLDSDDYWIENNILSLFITKLHTGNLDVVRAEYVYVDEKSNRLFTSIQWEEHLNLKEQVLSSYEMMKYVINGKFFSWLFIFRKNAIENLRFNENLAFLEDMDFVIKLFSKRLRCGYLPIQFYAYRQREKSITSTPSISNIEDSFTFCDVFHEYAFKVEDKRLTSYYLYRGIMMYYWTLETVASDLFIHQYKEIEKNLSLISLRKKIYGWTKLVSQYDFPIHIYVSPYIGVRLFRLRWWGGRILRALKIMK